MNISGSADSLAQCLLDIHTEFYFRRLSIGVRLGGSREELHEVARKRNERDCVRSIAHQVPKRFPILPIKF